MKNLTEIQLLDILRSDEHKLMQEVYKSRCEVLTQSLIVVKDWDTSNIIRGKIQMLKELDTMVQDAYNTKIK